MWLSWNYRRLITCFSSGSKIISQKPESKSLHWCNGSIFLTVPVPVPELTQIIWRFRVRFQNWLRLPGGSSSGSRTDSDFLAVPGPVLLIFLIVLVFSFSISSNSWINCWLLDEFTENNHSCRNYFLLNCHIRNVFFSFY